ncbi:MULTISPECIES: DUF4149 domain-containing protein [unclassified Campylobacter]|uniref:DUF4149 domain-containing protein n=1 Tax=unclassified Campylobacter TaxID=2593542 RepID=UPI0022E9B7D4|nr:MULTISPECIES: DUF4149 domain-containing protein [unclassified Campylobacter]MDA3074235.1 DUF4149 domain-containing protein [Campylobacter sp. JMF_05 ED3]MDA3076837.1 DUF4149 domain-containing protein [Campylobacter sp. JMF_04 NA10]
MKAIFSIYILALGALIGIELSLGALVAPTIFYPQSLIGEGVLSHFQSGQMMSAIFVKYNAILMPISIICLIFEMVNFNNNKSQPFNLKLSTLMLALINLILATLFVLYFTEFILDAQKLGEAGTQTAEFAQIHKASEWCAKLMIIAQTVLFFLKMVPNLRIGRGDEI